MKGRFAWLLVSLSAFSACDEKPEVVVTETRPLTTRDKPPKLFATSDERFRDAKPGPVMAGATPDGWLALPASQFRLLNYRFGESGMGEVWVSVSAGSVLDKVNRRLGQFGAEPIDAAAMAKLPAAEIAGTTGVWVEAAGEYAAGMGAAPKPGFALAGVIADTRHGILTVKMVGPVPEVRAARATLESFAKTLRLAD
jgi:hypothetical protein